MAWILYPPIIKGLAMQFKKTQLIHAPPYHPFLSFNTTPVSLCGHADLAFHQLDGLALLA